MYAQGTHADLAHSHFWKAWLCNVLKIIKGRTAFLEGDGQQGHKIESKMWMYEYMILMMPKNNQTRLLSRLLQQTFKG